MTLLNRRSHLGSEHREPQAANILNVRQQRAAGPRIELEASSPGEEPVRAHRRPGMASLIRRALPTLAFPRMSGTDGFQ